jgi:hypothetical protein
MRLQDKVAIITGASRGIGRAIALGFAREGTHVTLAARTQPELDAVAEEIHALPGGQPRALVVPTDVTVEEQVKAMVDAPVAAFGRVDILVNNAGVGAFRPAYGTPLKTWEWIMSIHATSTFLCTKHAWKPMRKAGGGSIINISSLSGTRIYPMYSAYPFKKPGEISEVCVEQENALDSNFGNFLPQNIEMILFGLFRQQMGTVGFHQSHRRRGQARQHPRQRPRPWQSRHPHAGQRV